LRTLYGVTALQLGSAFILVQAGPKLVMEKYGPGRMGSALSTLNQMAAGAAALELVLNPLLGRLSDQYGRKPVLLLGPLSTVLLRSLVAGRPTLTSIVLGRVVAGALLASYVTTASTMVADLESHKGSAAVAGATGRLYASIGVSVVVGALAGGVMTQRNAVLPYRASAAMGAICFALIALFLRETKQGAPPSSQASSLLDLLNPTKFIRLFTRSYRLGVLAAVSALQQAPVWMGDMWAVHGAHARGWGPPEMARFQAFMGLSNILSGVLCGAVVKRLGSEMFSKTMNALSIMAYAGFSVASSSPIVYASQVLNILPMQRSSAVNALLLEEGAAQGMGAGEVSAYKANLIAVVKIVAPLMYGWLFAFGQKRGMAGLPYASVCAVLLAAHAAMSTLSPEDWKATKQKAEANQPEADQCSNCQDEG